MSVVASGLVTMFFSYANDRDACNRIQSDRAATAEYLEERSDPTLGNPAKGIPAADFSKPPYDRFAEFEELIIQNARADRARAQEYRRRIDDESCGLLP